jgi:hypothetical protein
LYDDLCFALGCDHDLLYPDLTHPGQPRESISIPNTPFQLFSIIIFHVIFGTYLCSVMIYYLSEIQI